MNPLIEKVRQAVLAKADPRLVPVIEKIEAAGQKVMYAEKTRGQMFKQLGDGSDPEAVGQGVAKLVGILFNESKRTAPMEALIPAAVLLLCEGLDFLEQSGAVKVTNEFISDCTLAMGSSVAQMFGATPDKLQGMVDASGKPPAPAPAAAPAPGGILASAQPPAGGM